MRKIAVALIAAFMMSAALPVLADEAKPMRPMTPTTTMTQEQKDQCLLYSKNCMGQMDTLQTKIRRLNAEIQKGDRVYSPDEIKRLNQKLKEAEDIVDVIQRGGGS